MIKYLWTFMRRLLGLHGFPALANQRELILNKYQIRHRLETLIRKRAKFMNQHRLETHIKTRQRDESKARSDSEMTCQILHELNSQMNYQPVTNFNLEDDILTRIQNKVKTRYQSKFSDQEKRVTRIRNKKFDAYFPRGRGHVVT